MFMSSTVETSVFMGKDYSKKLRSIEITGKNLTMEQVFDISGKILNGNIYFWSVMKKSSVSPMQKCTSFQILCCVLER